MRKGKDKKYEIIMRDIDYLKSVKENYGNEWGDRVIEDLGGILRKNIKKKEVEESMGGEELVVFMKGEDEVEENDMEKKMRKKMKELRL